MSAARSTTLTCLILTLLLSVLVSVLAPSLADARSRHVHPHRTHDASAAPGQTGSTRGNRRADDAHTKAASEELDKVLDSKIRNICRGC